MGYQFDFGALASYLTLFLKGAGVTLALTAIAATIGIALSIGGAATARWGLKWARALVAAYVELIRNTPFIVQLFFIFFGLPALGLKMTALQAAILAMTINLTAYAIEIVRAGIEAVPPGQREAGFALGLKPVSVFVYVILPQAIANVYPALVSQIIITMLESAVVSQIAVTDLTHVADFIQSRTYRAFETYFVITLAYLGMAVGLRWLMTRAGRRLFAGRLR
ncbi:MAG TPA: amino acid ABC transporter permease [Dongiaceae bacterium]|jgi:polar amino acid transport system permease protein|nr:amino acid ABC transporter permease [Dongiaceae bacterium]